MGYYEAFAKWCTAMPNLQVIAIPCNQFGAQEPGTPEEIKAYVYGEVERGRGGTLSGKLKGLPNFTLLAKSTINGNGMHPIFKLAKAKFPGETNCEFHRTFGSSC